MPEQWIVQEGGGPLKQERNIVKKIAVVLPSFLLILCALTFISWALASTFYVVQATNAIAGTTLLCADRMIKGVEESQTLTRANDVLVRENTFMRGRLSAFEKLYGLSKGTYTDAVGGSE